MSGIAGIIKLHGETISDRDERALSLMQKALCLSEDQKSDRFVGKTAVCVSVIPCSKESTKRYIYNEVLEIVCQIDGYLFISSDEKAIVASRFDVAESITPYELIPYLFSIYGEDTSIHLTGSYNLFIYNLETNRVLLTNDRFGYLPMYYYVDDNQLIFGSKTECLLASGLMPKIEYDYVTIAEHLFFNYPLSDNTYIKNIRTLQNSTNLYIDSTNLRTVKYWSMSELYDTKALSGRDSFELFDFALGTAIDKLLSQVKNTSNFTLTGGWDSRIVLSYLLPDYREKLNLYSFGAAGADDVVIPKYIAAKEGLDYFSVVLDDDYLKNEFLLNACQTIELSSGTRNIKRAHYLFAIKKMSVMTPHLLTGIFGDEVLKISRPQGGAVLSSNTIKLLINDFNPEPTLFDFKNSGLCANCSFPNNILDELRDRIVGIQETFNQYNTKSQKYMALRFEINLRKYFGNEASSYNDFAYCYSPFIDYDFIKSYSQTIYAGFRYNFNSNSIMLKQQSSNLYSKLVLKHYPQLAYYPSSRRFNMIDTNNAFGILKILYKKFIDKPAKNVDGYNTGIVDMLFEDMLSLDNSSYREFLDKLGNSAFNSAKTNVLSLVYWMAYIRNKYQ